MDTTNYQRCLKRILTTTTHEICHMFSMKHCKEYKCMMNGSLTLEEAEKKPSYLCPECHAKLIYCTKTQPIERFNNLIRFYEKHGFLYEKNICEQAKMKIELTNY